MKRIFLIVVLFMLIFSLASCKESDDTFDGTSSLTDKEEPKETVMVELTLIQLSTFNGLNGNKAYIAVDGDIYDVTDEWGSGSHNGINAGTDATSKINEALHGKSILEDLEKVGTLVD